MAGRRASESARARDRGGRLRRGGRGLRRFARQNPLAVVGGLILLSAVLACALAPVLTPSDPIKTGLSGWVLYARTVRANLLSIRSLEYVEAARALGAGGLRIIVRHILPNTTAPILVIGSAQFATMVLLETGLSFLGLGIQAPRPSWGNMMAEGRDYLSNAWWLATIPGAAISLVVLGANLFGDGLRDLLDPRLRHR